jgi:hypothetical protein
MSVSIKAVCALVLFVASTLAVLMWLMDRPNATIWFFRVGAPIAALTALAVILKLHFRADLAVDYLRKHTGSYFNRDGFCFAFDTTYTNGVAYLEAYFQNQRDTPCLGRIALRPARGFWMGRAKIEMITFELDCAPAAFGVAKIAVPLPQKLQGKRQSFEVGASVQHPEGKGQTLRFHDGIFIRTNAKFGSGFTTALTIAGAAGGTLVLSQPATVQIELPSGVAEDVPDDIAPEIRTLWKLGDPPLGDGP